jgi:hypothetical protein
MYFDDVDSRRLCDDDLRVIREIAQTPSGQRSIRRAIVRLKFRIAWLCAWRYWLELWNAPRVVLESPEPDARSFLVAQVVLYVLTAVALLAGVVRVLR